MPSNAVVYWTGTVVDASPDHTVPIAIATITKVAASPYSSFVSIEGVVGLTIGADPDVTTLVATLNTATGTQIGNELTVPIDPIGVAILVPFNFTGQLSSGTHTICITLDQGSSSNDATVSAVTAVVLVGD